MEWLVPFSTVCAYEMWLFMKLSRPLICQSSVAQHQATTQTKFEGGLATRTCSQYITITSIHDVYDICQNQVHDRPSPIMRTPTI